MQRSLTFYDNNCTTSPSTITSIAPDGTWMTLSETPFYPQGGGQPGDRGVIISPTGTFTVTDTKQDRETGNICHFGAMEGGVELGQSVTAQVDTEFRSINNRLHSAGHIIDLALAHMGRTHWENCRSYHFSEGPYVSYMTPSEEPLPSIEEMEVAIHEIISLAMPGTIRVTDDYRSVQFGDAIPVGCGGTHVANTRDIGPIAVSSIKQKKGVTTIKYHLHEIVFPIKEHLTV